MEIHQNLDILGMIDVQPIFTPCRELHYGPFPDGTTSIEAARQRLPDSGTGFVFRDELR